MKQTLKSDLKTRIKIQTIKRRNGANLSPIREEKKQSPLEAPLAEYQDILSSKDTETKRVL